MERLLWPAVTGWLLLLAGGTLLWMLSVRRRDATIADIGWGPGFAVLAWAYPVLTGTGGAPRQLLALAITLWGLRLAWHIGRRHHGEDRRYRALREAAGVRFWWTSLLTVFWLQGTLLWLVALPLLTTAAAASREVRWTDGLGGLLMLAGFLIEAAADAQLSRFRRTAAPGAVLDTGLWRYSRHPNYFGDALFWWGVWVVASSAPFGLATVLSPALMTWLLVRVSGVALLDRTLSATRPAYRDYIARTSAFIPWPPRRSAATDPSRPSRALLACALAGSLTAGLAAGGREESQMITGDMLPALHGEYLSGRKASLPEDARGKVAVILMGFTYASRTPVEAWAERLKPALTGLNDTTFYEVPVIGGMARMGKWFIDSGMRRGTPKALHEHVITVWGAVKEWKARAGVTNERDTLAYLTLIDRDGRIHWRHAGPFDEETFEVLMAELRSLSAGASRSMPSRDGSRPSTSWSR